MVTKKVTKKVTGIKGDYGIVGYEYSLSLM